MRRRDGPPAGRGEVETGMADDGAVVRCWDGGEPMRSYHDQEWGRPVTGEALLLERLVLEGFQSGLSWSVILRKRPGFRAAFAGFDPVLLARYGEEEVERLLGDPGIVRNRRKIEAAIANAQAALALREQGRSLDELIWSFRPPPSPAPRSFADVPATTPASIALAKELRRAGFRFVGPTTVYATMQACGLVNDHIATCFVRDEVAEEQRGWTQPLARQG
jgi:DNA-3-methyladenine glycosylase I